MELFPGKGSQEQRKVLNLISCLNDSSERCGHILPGGGENTHDGKLRVWHVNVPMECGYSSVSHSDNGKFVTFWIWPIFYARKHIKFQLLFHGPKWLSEVCKSSFSFPDSAKFADHTIGFVGTTPFGRLCIGTFDGQDPVPYGKSPIVQQSFTHLDWLAGFCPSRILQQLIGNLLTSLLIGIYTSQVVGDFVSSPGLEVAVNLQVDGGWQ